MTLEQTSLVPEAIHLKFKQIALQIKFFLGSLFYLTYAPQAYWYSRRRDRLEQAFAPSTNESATAAKAPGKLVQAESTKRGAIFYFEQAELEIDFLTADLVRLTWKPGLLPIPYAIVKSTDPSNAEEGWQAIDVKLQELEAGWQIYSAKLRVVVGLSGSIQFYDTNHQLLREEMPPQQQGEAWSHRVKLRPEENIYGLGERAARLNLRSPLQQDDSPGRTYRLWNYDAAGMYGPGSDPMYICIPLYISLHHQGSYLVFYENSFEGEVSFTDVASVQFTGGALRYYVAIGSPANLLTRYSELTGRAPLPPQWALGYHQSRWGYRTEAAVRETVQTFEDLDLPLSAIHLDIDVQVGYRAFTIDPDRFPQLGKFTQELASEGVKFITILNPGVKHSRKSKLFLEGRMLEAFCKLPNGEIVVAPVWCGWSVFPDFTHPSVRQWWSRQYEFMLDLGVAGFWHDMNEPAAFIAWGDRSLPKVTQHYLEGRGGDHREAHNVYGFLQAKAGYESLRQYRTQQRPFIVSRAGWAGLQRYAWTWTGDIECTWECLYQTISTVLGLGLSGIPYSGPDIGGFQGNPSGELYLRWFQMATFMPFYRSHCSNNVEYRAPWTYGEPILSIIRSFLKLRYQLMPYLYTLAWESTQTGAPLVRPLFWYHADDARFWSVDDTFYLGETLLVFPVLEEGARSRLITLPKGVWFNFWNDEILKGSQQIEVVAPLEQIPLLVKAGSILPLQDKQQLRLHLYPALEETEQFFTLYSDARDGYGASRVDRFQFIRFPEGLEIIWHTEGEFSFPYEHLHLHLHHFKLQQIWQDDVEIQLNPPGDPTLSDREFIYSTTPIFKKIFFKGEVI